MKTYLLIPTAGRPRLFARLLDSLLDVELPPAFESIIVIENGPRGGAEAACRDVSHRLPIHYVWSEQPGKSVALNVALERIERDALAVMTDDDVRFERDTLLEYQRAAARRPTGWFFGGPFAADFESPPPEWLLRYLPPSACGWSPEVAEFDPTRDRFYGCNWAAFARDLRAIGGFDLRYGPGSAGNSTGQETDAQRRLQANGINAGLLPDARVWHWVPQSRCSPEWALDRARRNGVARGIRMRTRSAANGIANTVMNALRLTTAAAESVFVRGDSGRRRFDVEYRRQKAAGYFEGIRRDAA